MSLAIYNLHANSLLWVFLKLVDSLNFFFESEGDAFQRGCSSIFLKSGHGKMFGGVLTLLYVVVPWQKRAVCCCMLLHVRHDY
jgi:hypothetical protein